MDAYMTVFNVEISPPAMYTVRKKKETTSWQPSCVLPRGWEFSHPGGVRIVMADRAGCVGDRVWPVVRGGAFRELQV